MQKIEKPWSRALQYIDLKTLCGVDPVLKCRLKKSWEKSYNKKTTKRAENDEVIAIYALFGKSDNMPINATTATADTQLNRQKSESPKKPQTIAFNNVFFLTITQWARNTQNGQWTTHESASHIMYE